MVKFLTDPIFTDAYKAREHLEAQRWPDGPVCPHRGATDEHVTAIRSQRSRPSKAHPDGVVRMGLHQCNACRKQITVTVGTVFKRSKVPLNKWLLATYLTTSSKKGISAHQPHLTCASSSSAITDAQPSAPMTRTATTSFSP